ncbi:MYB family protein [Quillaja saponaria]|uniref:MYB family protein n=1 Tax=Quillaja saponaria TaxID=32244 RepID=A0AAD7Q5C6_QUISA|nr:MYB family protein [Quillaja saponaria]
MSLHADDNEDEELSGGEDDEDFNKDMEEIRKACILTGTDPTDLKITSNASDGSSSDGESTGARAAGGAAPATDSDDDDLELVRDIQNRFSGAGISSDPVTNSDDDQEDHELLESIKNRFSITSDVPQILSLKPLCALPPAVSDEDEDDFETLRAIQKRFSAYDNAAEISKSTVEKSLKKPEVVNNSILCSEEEAADRLIFNRTDAQDACTTTNLLSENVEMRHCGFLESNKSEACKSSKLTGRSSSFPVSAQLLIDAIKKNRSYQKFLRSKLIQIEAKIEENKKLKERVKILKDFQVSCRKRTGHALSLKKDPRVQLISAKRLYASNNSKVSAMYYGPEENTHVTNYRMVLERFPLSLDRRKWSKADKENLGKGIRQKFQEMVLQISIDRFSGSEGSDANDFDNIFASIKDLDITPEKIREFVPKVNWDQLASMYVIGHSGAECEARWLNYEDPLINQNPWTCEEDKTLLLIVEEKGIRNWFNISISMGTNRTPFQCLARYQRSLNPSILNREWTEEEDAKLRSAVEAFGESNWQSVASSLERRTGTQCSNRWKKSLHPERKGGFTPDEDKRLKVAVMLFGRKWNKIAQFVPGRTQAQCRDRYVNCLDPSLKWGGWSEEEDSTLKVAIAKHGYCWSKVAEDVPPAY